MRFRVSEGFRVSGRGGARAHQVVDAQLFELQHDGAQVGAQDLGVGLLLQVLLEGVLRVQPEALARLRAPGAPGPLVRARLHRSGGVWRSALGSLMPNLGIGLRVGSHMRDHATVAFRAALTT